MFDNFGGKNSSSLNREHNLTFMSSNGELHYTLKELQISFKTYAENSSKGPIQIISELKIAFKKAGIEKSEIEIEKFLELASMTRNSALEVFRRVRNIE